MIRATVDTNILASGALAQKGAIASLMDAWRGGRVEFVVSRQILLELDRALRKPYFAARLDERDRRAFLNLLVQNATVVEVTEPVPAVLVDSADNQVLAAAMSANCPYIISGDRELQRLGEFQGVTILSSRAFLDILTRDQGAATSSIKSV